MKLPDETGISAVGPAMLWAAGILAILLGTPPSFGDPSTGSSLPGPSATPAGEGPPSANTFADVGKLGLGFAMAPIAIVTNLPGMIILGFLDLRKWYRNRWGVDAGIGFGFADVSPGPESFQLAAHAEPMFRLVEQPDFVFFTDMNLLSTLSLQNGTNAGSFLLSYGFGFEKAFVPAPVAISLQ